MEYYYIDSCIWLNIIKKEKIHWQTSEEFIKKISNSNEYKIVYSKLILRELKFKIWNKEYIKILNKFKKGCQLITLTGEDYHFAREFESNIKYEISFYDCLHIAICKREGYVLVTRDKKLIKFAEKYVKVSKPESII